MTTGIQPRIVISGETEDGIVGKILNYIADPPPPEQRRYTKRFFGLWREGICMGKIVKQKRTRNGGVEGTFDVALEIGTREAEKNISLGILLREVPGLKFSLKDMRRDSSGWVELHIGGDVDRRKIPNIVDLILATYVTNHKETHPVVPDKPGGKIQRFCSTSAGNPFATK